MPNSIVFIDRNRHFTLIANKNDVKQEISSSVVNIRTTLVLNVELKIWSSQDLSIKKLGRSSTWRMGSYTRTLKICTLLKKTIFYSLSLTTKRGRRIDQKIGQKEMNKEMKNKKAKYRPKKQTKNRHTGKGGS